MRPLIINQFFGLGDCIFSQTIAHEFLKQNYSVLWPVKSEFVDGLNAAYPCITFIDQKQIAVDYENKEDRVIDGTRIIPLRWSVSICKVPYSECMSSKYKMFNLDYRIWKHHAMWQRNTEAEILLFATLGLDLNEPYNLINRTFRTNSTGVANIDVNNGIKNVEMKEMPGYSLFDWAFVIEKAANIFTVSTSVLFMIEVLKLKQPIHLYPRLPDEADFKNVEYLFTKPYILHL